MHKWNYTLGMFVTATLFLALLGGNNLYAEDDVCDEVGENHGDNSPSEKKFFNAIKTDDVCELTEKLDAMKLDGQIEEDGKCDIECFRELPVWTEKPSELSEDGFIEIKGCMLVRYEDFPKDNGDFHLAGYEIRNCGLGDY